MKKVYCMVLFLVLAFSNVFSQTDNWNDWKAIPDSIFGANNSVRNIAWGGVLGQLRFVAVASSDRIPVAYSENGEEWTAVEDRSRPVINYVAGKMIVWGGPVGRQRFVRVESYVDVPTASVEMLCSPEGIEWTFHSGFQNNTWNDHRSISNVIWGGPAGQERFIGVGDRMVMFSTNGETWRRINLDFNIGGLAWGGPAGQQMFIAASYHVEAREVPHLAGEGMTMTIFDRDSDIYILHSTDGEKWVYLTGEPVLAFSLLPRAIVWGGPIGQQRFVAVFSNGAIAHSTDGANWTAVSNSTFGSSGINAIAWGGPIGGERFVAVGNDGKIAHSVNGVNWIAVPNSPFGTAHINDIAVGRQRFVAVGNNGKMAYLDF